VSCRSWFFSLPPPPLKEAAISPSRFPLLPLPPLPILSFICRFLHAYLDRQQTHARLKDKGKGAVLLRLGSHGLVASIATADEPEIADVAHVEVEPALPAEVGKVLCSAVCRQVVRTNGTCVDKAALLALLAHRATGGYITVIDLLCDESHTDDALSPTSTAEGGRQLKRKRTCPEGDGALGE
jgi:hypothetical protein